MTDQHPVEWTIERCQWNRVRSDNGEFAHIYDANKKKIFDMVGAELALRIVAAVNALPFRCDSCDKEFFDEEVLYYSMDEISHFDCDNPDLRCSRCGLTIEPEEIIHSKCLEDSDPKEK